MAFHELLLLEELISKAQKFATIDSVGNVKVKELNFPIYTLQFGSKDKAAPTFGLFGGVHGLERVGSHVVINYLKGLVSQLEWDDQLRELFSKVRIVSIPIVNPGGMYLARRSNPNGVDIMRNAPIESKDKGFFMVSGHKISPKLPWYRGNPDEMELETKALVDFVKNEMLQSDFSMALDVHSGFGMRDRIWYPFSHSKDPLPHKNTVKNFTELTKESLAYHIYMFEQQTDSYLIHGDPWDYLYLEHLRSGKAGSTFIPWCLEMGSWTWLKKNPTQLFSALGLFNPILPHRYNRIMRRHRGLIDLFWRATLNHKSWSDKNEKLATAARTGA